MDEKYVKQEDDYILSNLQKNILLTICKTPDADYHSLEEKLKRTRTTIVQSLTPLRNQHFVLTIQVNPGIDRSKLIFRPTAKGFYYAIAFLGLDPDNEIISVNLDNEKRMKGYTDFIRLLPNRNARKEFLFQTSKLIMKYKPFDNNGAFVVGKFQDIIGLGFRYGLIESAKEGKNLMDDESLDKIKTILRPEELKELQEFCLFMRNNIDYVIKKMSKDASS